MKGSQWVALVLIVAMILLGLYAQFFDSSNNSTPNNNSTSSNNNTPPDHTNLESSDTWTLVDVTIPKGTTYYESSWNFGSGRSGTFSEDTVVTVSGYAYLDHSGNVVYSQVRRDGKAITIHSYSAPYIFVYVAPSGWVDGSSIRY